MITVKKNLTDTKLITIIDRIISSREYKLADILKFGFGKYEGSLPSDENKVVDHRKEINRLLKQLGYSDKENNKLIFDKLSLIQNKLKDTYYLYMFNIDDSLREENKFTSNIDVCLEKGKYTLLEVIFISSLNESLKGRLRTSYYSKKNLTINERYHILSKYKECLEYGSKENSDSYYKLTPDIVYSSFVKYSDNYIKRKIFGLVTEYYKKDELYLALLVDEYNKIRHSKEYMIKREALKVKDIEELKQIVKNKLSTNFEEYNISDTCIWNTNGLKKYIDENYIQSIKEKDENSRKAANSIWKDDSYVVERISNSIIEECKMNTIYMRSIDSRLIQKKDTKSILRKNTEDRIRKEILDGRKKGREGKVKLKEVDDNIIKYIEVFETLINKVVHEWEYIDDIANRIAQPMNFELMDLFNIYNNDKVLLNENAGLFLENNQQIGKNDWMLRLCIDKCNSFFKLEDGISKELCKKMIAVFDQELRNLRETMPLEKQKEYTKIYKEEINNNCYKSYNEILLFDKENEEIWLRKRKEQVKEKSSNTIIVDRNNRK